MLLQDESAYVVIPIPFVSAGSSFPYGTISDLTYETLLHYIDPFQKIRTPF